MFRIIYFKLFLLFLSFIGKSLTDQANIGFTIDTEGKKVITTQITGQTEFSAIAFTEIGTLIKYKSDTSIASTQKFTENGISGYTTSSFICQYTTNKVVLTRDKKIFEITFNSNGEDSLTFKEEANQIITNLHCNNNKYIYTYLSSDSTSYNFKVSGSSLVTVSSQALLSSSCFLSNSNQVLCINIIQDSTKLSYYYHNSGSSNVLRSSEITFNGIYQIKGALIKYYPSSEILCCLSAKSQLISDISFYCYLLKIDTNTRSLIKRNTADSNFEAIQQINGDVNYCQIEKLNTDYLYATICLSYYYRTKYLLSIIQFDENNNKFIFYKPSSDEYKNIPFALLKVSPISIIVFTDDTLGIFYKDIDNDSMILVFYPKCGKDFDYAPLEDSSPISCDLINSPSSSTSSDYYYDECTHSYLLKSNILSQGYTTYEKNQFCKIKRIECDNTNNYIKDNYVNGYYKCRNKNEEIVGYYFDSGEGGFQKCDSSCSRCKGPSNQLDDNNCKECNNSTDYYKFTFENPQKCLHKDEPLEHYFFDNQDKKFKECRKECLTCTEYPNNFPISDETDLLKNTSCTKCDTSTSKEYFPQVDNPSNCINKDRTDIKYYYFNSAYQRWEKCADGCLYCTEYGTSIYDTKCIKKGDEFCDTEKGYYRVENDTVDTFNQNCFQKDVRYDYYYFDETEQYFKKCHTSCLHCDNSYNCLPNKCNEKDGYFPVEGSTSVCLNYQVNSNANYQNYYFDPNTKLFKKCHDACATCKEQIDVTDDDTQCSTCSSNYFPLEGSVLPPDIIKCYHKDREGYYHNTDDGFIHKCPDKCSKCGYTQLTDDTSKVPHCTACNNEIGFYQRENEYLEHPDNIQKYMECYTWRKEKLNADSNNHSPGTNTVLVGNIFKYCNAACTQCTAEATSEFDTHCQAKKCSTGYIYVQNNEDICYKSSEEFPLHFKYHDPILNEDYFKPCYHTCKKCWAAGTKNINNCTSCLDGYIFHPNNITNAYNCIFDCLTLPNKNYYYLDEDNNDEYICVEKCPEKYPFLRPDIKRCLKSCSTETDYKYSKDRICLKGCPPGTTDNINKECVSVSNSCAKSDLESDLILNNINSNKINSIITDYCHDYSYTSNQINYYTNKLNEFNIIIYKNKNCLEEFYKNEINFPDLSVCFEDLKKAYGINQNQDLIVMFMNIYGIKSYTKVEYKIFDSINCKELDLSFCKTKNIFTEIYMSNFFSESEIQKSKNMYLNNNINVYDRGHPFFTDICYQYTYDNDKDMILQDRVDLYYQDISNICEKNCEPKADFDKKIIKCECQLKEKFLAEDNNEEENDYSFGSNSVSIDVFKCSGKAFLWKYFKKNIGNYTSLVLIVAEIPVIIYFIINGLNKVKMFLIPFMGVNPPRKVTFNIESENENINSNNNLDNNNEEKNEKNNYNEINNINNEIKVNEVNSEEFSSKGDILSNQSRNIHTKNISDKSSDDSLLKKDISDSKTKFVKKKYDIYKDIIDVEDFNDVELYDARNLDKRKFCEFYYQELKNTQPIIYSFFYHTPLTPRFFKILHFIFNTTLCFVFNAFFFSKKYISEKCFYFENSFDWYFTNIYDRILYTCLCTIIISLILRVLTSSKKKMLMWIKREKDPEVFNKEITYMMKRMKINYIIYSSVQGAFMFLFWIYLSCFCIAYKNNELEWFITSLICFGLIQIWYFISTFIVTCLRFLGIKCGMESCYNISLCLAFD